jgi:hypothetical protein
MEQRTASVDFDAIDRLRQVLAQDEALETTLAAIEDPAAFRGHALDLAIAHGIGLSAADLDTALAANRHGRWGGPSDIPSIRHWPSRHWLVTRVISLPDGQIVVDWAHFGGMRLDDPFYDISVQRALCRPFNRLWRYRMTLADFLAAAPAEGFCRPGGLVFHMSRCGSTLVAQMLASVNRYVVLSEAGPLDAIVQLPRVLPDMSEDDHARYLAAMVAALGRRRSDDAETAIFKLDCWHALSLPLFRRAFPDVPWIFLYREPVEVMVSHLRQRGVQTVPGLLDPGIFGIEAGSDMRGETYCALILDRICAAVIAHFDLGGGLLVNYDALPDALIAAILPHFGIEAHASEQVAMLAATQRDSKRPTETFSYDKLAKQSAANDAVRAAVEQGLASRYAALEYLRQAALA